MSDPTTRSPGRSLAVIVLLVLGVPSVSVAVLLALLALPDAVALPLSLAGLCACLCVPWALQRSAAQQATQRAVRDAQQVQGWAQELYLCAVDVEGGSYRHDYARLTWPEVAGWGADTSRAHPGALVHVERALDDGEDAASLPRTVWTWRDGVLISSQVPGGEEL
ncbi:hypothetical protein [Actinomadura atramentaria]|uniref:hypothetical protein n=1 Tax=Actinomadura atramentaria TaxID=1990 RepID=UPI00037CA9C0|nr:hypothetical protein [Actinomadura atramentaria]